MSENFIINEHFKNTYLTCGRTHDNFIFENCPKEILSLAKNSLSQNSNNVKSCCITINRDIEQAVEKTLEKFENILQKKIICKDFIIGLFALELLKNLDEDLSNQPFSKEEIIEGINAILNGCCEDVKNFCTNAPLPYDIKKLISSIGKIELNIFLNDTKNVYLQNAINNFISSREPYSIKLFTTNQKLPSYLDQNGNYIECPHDFMTRNIQNFITTKKKNI